MDAQERGGSGAEEIFGCRMLGSPAIRLVLRNLQVDRRLLTIFRNIVREAMFKYFGSGVALNATCQIKKDSVRGMCDVPSNTIGLATFLMELATRDSFPNPGHDVPMPQFGIPLVLTSDKCDLVFTRDPIRVPILVVAIPRSGV